MLLAYLRRDSWMCYFVSFVWKQVWAWLFLICWEWASMDGAVLMEIKPYRLFSKTSISSFSLIFLKNCVSKFVIRRSTEKYKKAWKMELFFKQMENLTIIEDIRLYHTKGYNNLMLIFIFPSLSWISSFPFSSESVLFHPDLK